MSDPFSLIKSDLRVREVGVWFDLNRRRVEVRIRRLENAKFGWGVVYPSGSERVPVTGDEFESPEDALQEIMTRIETDEFWVEIRNMLSQR